MEELDYNCVSTTTLVVLVNGSLTDFFFIEKGLRQGDLLSAMLFNLYVHDLSILWNNLVNREEPCGFRVGSSLCLNHL